MENESNENLNDVLITSEPDINQERKYQQSLEDQLVIRGTPSVKNGNERWISDYESIAPDSWRGQSKMNVPIPDSEKGFFELFFTDEIEELIYFSIKKETFGKYKTSETKDTVGN